MWFKSSTGVAVHLGPPLLWLPVLVSATFIPCLPAFASGYQAIYTFQGSPDGSGPVAALTVGGPGLLYGTTENGGSSLLGTVFTLTKSATGNKWTEAVVHSFGGADGANPISPVLATTNGTIYGTAYVGGPSGRGTVFSLTNPSAWSFQVLHSFGLADGGNPRSGLALGLDGLLYGTTAPLSGHNGSDYGTDFSISPLGDQVEYQVLHDFGQPGDGSGPYGLAAVPPSYFDGFIGTTQALGAHGYGTVYSLQILVGGQSKETTLYSFGVPPDVGMPSSPPIVGQRDLKKAFYGCAPAGGTHGRGGIYKLAVSDSGPLVETVLYNFGDQPIDPDPGTNGTCSIVQGVAPGTLYGTTPQGGTGQSGAFFELDAPTNPHGSWKEKVDVSFKPRGVGSAPQGAPVAIGGVFYGSMQTLNGNGAIYQLIP